jgi:hypothetical protein
MHRASIRAFGIAKHRQIGSNRLHLPFRFALRVAEDRLNTRVFKIRAPYIILGIVLILMVRRGNCYSLHR